MSTFEGARAGAMRGGTLAPAHTISLWERYIAGAGLTVTLTAAVLIAITWPIHEGRWVVLALPVPLVALMGLALATVFVFNDYPAARGHISALAIGFALVLLVGLGLSPGDDFINRTGALIAELSGWVAAISTDEVRAGVVEFGMFMTALAWLLGYGGGWMVLRRHVAWPLVLLGAPVVLLVLTNLGAGRGLWLALFMATSALLMIHVSTVRRLVVWRGKRLAFDPFTVLSQSGFMLAFGLSAALIASVLPAPRVAPLGGLAHMAQGAVDTVEVEFSRLFHGLPSRLSFKTITYGERVSFRGNPNLTDQLLFTVAGDQATYWRARAYSEYTSSGWRNTEAQFMPFNGVADPGYEQRVETEHYYRIHAATDTFLTGGLPVAVSEPADALVHQSMPWDVHQLRLQGGGEFFPTRTNLRYTSSGSLSAATPSQLRAAGTNYPLEVLLEYLQLPSTVPLRVLTLSVQLTSGLETPYEKAEAIRGYLSTIPYNLDIPAPPAGRDGVDWFLFDQREGYCDYYASAMVVMLRGLSIPARYVLGYTSGARDPNTGQFQVLDLNYHAWVEVYFPGYGWYPFEPTPPNAISFGGPGNEPIQPAATAPNIAGGFIDDEEEEENGFFGPFDFEFENEFEGTVPAVIGTIFVALLVMIGLLWYRLWWRLGQLNRADELYAKLLRLSSMLGFPRQQGQTPHEYATVLSEQFPDDAADIRTVAETYSRRRYAGETVPINQLRRAEESWNRLRWVFLKRLFGVRPA